jgi:hypothetical protein
MLASSSVSEREQQASSAKQAGAQAQSTELTDLHVTVAQCSCNDVRSGADCAFSHWHSSVVAATEPFTLPASMGAALMAVVAPGSATASARKVSSSWRR